MRPSPLDVEFARFLRKARGEKSYREFAPKVGLSRSAFFRIENLEQSVTLSKLHAILKRLKARLPDVFAG